MLKRSLLACSLLSLTQVWAASPGAVEQSKKENGLVIYGNVAADNVAPSITEAPT